MKFLSWNAGGVRGSGPGQAKADWLLTHLHSMSDIAVLAIQETHCITDDQLALSIHEMNSRYKIIHSPATDADSYAGVLFAVSKEFAVENEQILLDGRVLSIRLRSLVYENVFDVIVVYGYPTGREEWLHHLEEAIDVDVPTIILGDFNFVMEGRDRDISKMHQYDISFSTKMNDMIEGLELTDAHTQVNDTPEYTYHGFSSSRIDRIYVSQALAGQIKSFKCTNVLGKSTGHKMLTLELTEQIEMGKGYWKFNTSLLKDPTYTDMIKTKITKAREERDRNDWSDIRQWWDYLKFLIKTATIAYCREKQQIRCDFLANLH